MDSIEKLRLLENNFLKGKFPTQELPLRLEPLLWQISKSRLDEEAVRRIMNDLELVLFTLPAQEQAAAAVKLLRDARVFAEKGS